MRYVDLKFIGLAAQSIFSQCCAFAVVAVLAASCGQSLWADESPDFNAHVLPVLRKYCNGCHNSKDAEAGLILEDHARAMKGGENGVVIIPGKSGDSRLWKLVSRQDDPQMPPSTSAQPSAVELEVLKKWIDAGAKAPRGVSQGLVTPKIAMKSTSRDPVTSIAISPDGKLIAVGKAEGVEIARTADNATLKQLKGHSGSVNEVTFSADGKWLVVASGEAGLDGEATLWKTDDWSRGSVLKGHRDAVYSAQLNRDGTQLITAGYDKDALVWDVSSGKTIRTLSGHNDALYSTAIHPNGRWAATASGDRTVKLWDIGTGQRIDTFAQPSKEQSTLAISPNGKYVVSGGVDMRIRVWLLSETAREGTNPILYARFAHEGPILKVAFSPDGRLLASSSEDRRIKLWETQSFTQVAQLERQKDWAAALAFTPDGKRLFVGRMNGEVSSYEIKPTWGDAPSSLKPIDEAIASTNDRAGTAVSSQTEIEPNDLPSQATSLSLPGIVRGEFKGTVNGSQGDTDLFKIEAKAGQTWILETKASRSGSMADTKIEVLHSDGTPVLRALLQAVRDSWINFRPIDSSSPDVRVEFWEEMDLNQYLFMTGEICKTFRAPQGPDSGFQLYTSNGKRRCYFDTSATAHAKDEPVYIVEAFPPGSEIVDNGLPVFPLYFANDDDADRKLDKDSRLTFVAPRDGLYLVKVSDTRGFTGEKNQYSLSILPPVPAFEVTVATMNPKIPAGSGQRIKFNLNRIDTFDGDVRIDIAGLPAGFEASSPVVIASGVNDTNCVLSAAKDAVAPQKEDWERVTVLATGLVDGRLVTKTVGSLGEIKLEAAPKIRVSLVPDNPKFTSPEGFLLIQPGTTITAKIIVERNGFDGDVKFDVDNLPHGIIVDNIGLSGVLVRANETERQIFLTARPWVPKTSRLMHAVAQVQGNQASTAIRLDIIERIGLVSK